MDIILKTKKREFSLLLIPIMLFAIIILLGMIVVILFELLIGIIAWIDIFDGSGFNYWQLLSSNHYWLIAILGVIISLCFPIIAFGFLVFGIIRGIQFLKNKLGIKKIKKKRGD